METKIAATELSKNLSDVLNRTRYRGETFVVERNGDPVASLGPVSPPPGITVSELIARLGDLALPAMASRTTSRLSRPRSRGRVPGMALLIDSSVFIVCGGV